MSFFNFFNDSRTGDVYIPKINKIQMCVEIDAGLLADVLDQHLRRKNIEYDEKRASARLGSLQTQPVEAGYGETCKRAALSRGERESQYKPRVLEYLAAWPRYSGQLDEEAVTP